VMFVPDQKTGMDMVAYAALVTPQQGTARAIFMNEISERPSSYFFHLSNKLRDDVPFFKDKASKDMFHTIKKFGQRLGVTISPKNLNSLDLKADVKRTAANYACDIIIIGINSLEEKGESAFAEPTLRKTSSLLEVGLDHLVGPHSPTGEIVQQAVTDIQAPLGVHITKSHGTVQVTTIAFFYTAAEHEYTAWSQLLKVPKSVKVTVFTSDDALAAVNAEYNHELHPNITVLASSAPFDSLLEAQSDQPADLVIFGSKRGAINEGFLKIVREVRANVLVIFPAILTPKSPFLGKEKGKTHELAIIAEKV